MSGQWEVVGKKKDKAGGKLGLQSASIKEGKKNNPKSLRVEEVLPVSQIKKLYKTETVSNKENKIPRDKNTGNENGTKKQQKKVEKSNDSTKAKLPKSIESALSNIKVEEFKKLYDDIKTRFADVPLVWLKECAQFLNQRLTVEVNDPVFKTKPEGYPLSIVPSPLKSTIERTLKEAGKSNMLLFFDVALTSMAVDMSKGLPALGHKIYIQCIALTDPKLILSNLGKYVTLRNSYQNRPPIGLSILWSLGQTGVRDLQTGLKVFQEVMLPLIEMKNYSRYIIEYLINLIKLHNNSFITKEQYLLLQNVVFSNKKNLPSDLTKQLKETASNLNTMLLDQNGDKKYHTFIEPFLKKVLDSSNTQYQNNICFVIVTCLMRDPASFDSWSKIYTKHLGQSAVVLKYIDVNWGSFSGKLHGKLFLNLLNTFSVSSEELLLKKRKEPGLVDSINSIQKLKEKMVSKKRSGFSFRKLLFITTLAVIGCIYYDYKQMGNWQKTRTNKLLDGVGMYVYTEKIKTSATQANNYLYVTYPEYYNAVSNFSQPYVELGRDLSVIVYNIGGNVAETVVAKYPIMLKSIETYAPGIIEQSQKAVVSVWTNSIFYLNRSVDYLRNEVFVGKLSPENMQRVVMVAYNTTQQKATEYYHWLYEKVQTTIK